MFLHRSRMDGFRRFNNRRSRNRRSQLEQLERRNLLATYVVVDGSYPNGHVFDIRQPANTGPGVIRIPSGQASHSFSFETQITNSNTAFPAGSHAGVELQIFRNGIPSDSISNPTMSADNKVITFQDTLTVPVGTSDLTFRVIRSAGNPSFADVANARISTNVQRNRLPTSTLNSVAVAHGSSIQGNLGVTDADGDSLSYSIVTQPTRGTLSLTQAGIFTFTTLDPNFVGGDSFTYSVSDTIETVTKTVQVSVLNAGPGFNPSTLNTRVVQGQSVDINLGTGVTDDENDPIDFTSVVITKQPTQGTLSAVRFVAGLPVITYTTNSVNSDFFEYTLKDNLGAVSPPRRVNLDTVSKPRITRLIDDVAPATGSFAFPITTNDVSPTLSGTAEPNSRVTLLGFGSSISSTASASGVWQINLAALNLPRDNAIYTASVRSLSGGIAAESDPVQFRIDTRPPRVNANLPGNLRSSAIDTNFRFTFTEAANAPDGISGFTIADVSLRKGGGATDLLSSNPNVTLQALPSNASIQKGFRDTFVLTGLSSVTDATGSYLFRLDAATSGIRDAAGFALTNSLSSRFAVDKTAPIIVGSPRIISSGVKTELQVPVVDTGGADEAEVTYRIDLTEQSFVGIENSVTLTLVQLDREIDGTDTQTVLRRQTVVIPPASTQDNLTLSLPVDLKATIAKGTHRLKLLVQDKMGSTAATGEFLIAVNKNAAGTGEAQGTPVFSEHWFVGSTLLAIDKTTPNDTTTTKQILVDQPIPAKTIVSIAVKSSDGKIKSERTEVESSIFDSSRNGTLLTLKDSLTNVVPQQKLMWLRPWTTTFDKETQTTWLTTEDGVSVIQFDPATGDAKLFDVGLRGADGSATVGDPHGVTFDFNTHLEPRVWFVYRNSNLDLDLPKFPTDHHETPSTIAYLDVATKALRYVHLHDIQLTSSSDSNVQFLESFSETHAIFVDVRGHIWVTAEHADPPALLEIDLSRNPDGTTNSLSSPTGTIIVHNLPIDQIGDGAQVPVVEFEADVNSNRILSTNHGLVSGSQLRFKTDPTQSSTLPGGLLSFPIYYVINPTENDFQVSLTRNGNPVDLTSAGTGEFTYTRAFEVDISQSNTRLNSINHGLVDGNAITLETTLSRNLPQGLAQSTTYFVVNADANSFSLAFKAGGQPIQLASNTLGAVSFQKGIFLPHALTVEVDEITGTPYVFVADGAGSDKTPSRGRMLMLRPGVNGQGDLWTEWNLDAAMFAEGNRTNGTALFATIDNHETPGDLRDDRLILTDPGPLNRGAAGSIRVFDLGNVLSDVVKQDRLRAAKQPYREPTIPATGRVTSYVMPIFAGVQPVRTDLPFSSPQVPFVDRGGQVFYVDATNGFGRFFIDGDNQEFTSSVIDAPLATFSSDGAFGAITFSGPLPVPVNSFRAKAVTTSNSTDDRGSSSGLNQYDVSVASAAGYGGANQRGLFRGALDAENTLFGSLSNSDHLSTSMVAESNRRQLGVVTSPYAPPTGSRITGRACCRCCAMAVSCLQDMVTVNCSTNK